MSTTHFSGPVDSAAGFSVNGTTIITSAGAITADIQATALSIGTTEIANNAITSAKLAETTLQYAEVTLTATEIVGTATGDIAATAGAPLVAAQAGKVLEFVSAMLIYDFDTAAYTGGGNDVVIRQGTTAVSGVVTATDLLTAAGDKIVTLQPLAAAATVQTANSTLNIFATTAYTQPGTAAGVLRVKIAYRVHTTNL